MFLIWHNCRKQKSPQSSLKNSSSISAVLDTHSSQFTLNIEQLLMQNSLHQNPPCIRASSFAVDNDSTYLYRVFAQTNHIIEFQINLIKNRDSLDLFRTYFSKYQRNFFLNSINLHKWKEKLKLVFLTPFSSCNEDEDKNAENAGTIEDLRMVGTSIEN